MTLEDSLPLGETFEQAIRAASAYRFPNHLVLAQPAMEPRIVVRILASEVLHPQTANGKDAALSASNLLYQFLESAVNDDTVTGIDKPSMQLWLNARKELDSAENGLEAERYELALEREHALLEAVLRSVS